MTATPNIIETNLEPLTALSERRTTDMIVIHHTGEADIDASAEQIDQWHKSKVPPWAMIGYHFVIRKNGDIERGRPEWAVGSHAYGENYHTLGIHLSGDFMTAEPTPAQMESCAALVNYLCLRYGIPLDRDHIVGHCDLMETDCPGTNLYSRLNEIIASAQTGITAEDLQSAKTSGNDDEKTIWNFLKGKGLTDYAVAGIMGNLYAESELKSNNLENYYESKLAMTDAEYTAAVDDGSYTNFIHDKAGYGLAQWTYYTRKQALLNFARESGASIGDLTMQLNFFWQELQGYSNMLSCMQAANDVDIATVLFLKDFERPADQSTAVQLKRADFAQKFYDKFSGTTENDNVEVEEMRYNRLTDMPNWAQPTIKKMIEKGLLGGSGEKDETGNPIDLDLSIDMIRIFVVNDRAGIYN